MNQKTLHKFKKSICDVISEEMRNMVKDEVMVDLYLSYRKFFDVLSEEIEILTESMEGELVARLTDHAYDDIVKVWKSLEDDGADPKDIPVSVIVPVGFSVLSKSKMDIDRTTIRLTYNNSVGLEISIVESFKHMVVEYQGREGISSDVVGCISINASDVFIELFEDDYYCR